MATTITPQKKKRKCLITGRNFDCLWTYATITHKKWKNREFTIVWVCLTGIITAFKERNMRKHLVSAILVVLAGLIFRVSATEWLFLLMAVFLVIALEIVNSAIENVVDLASNYHFSMPAKKPRIWPLSCFSGFLLCSHYGDDCFHTQNLALNFQLKRSRKEVIWHLNQDLWLFSAVLM